MNIIKNLITIMLVACICFSSSFSFAETLEKEVADSMTEDEFDFIGFDRILESDNISEAEVIYKEWINKRKAMLDSGSEFGLLDVIIEQKHALIKYHQRNYVDAIAIEDKILRYLQANINDENDKNLEWTDLICESMYYKLFGYYRMGDRKKSLRVRQELLDFVKSKDPSNSLMIPILTGLVNGYYVNKDLNESIVFAEEVVSLSSEIYGEDSKKTIMNNMRLAMLKYDNGQFEEALKLIQDKISLMDGVFDLSEKLAVMDIMGVCYNRLGKFNECVNLAKQELSILRDSSAKYPQKEIYLLNTIALNLKNMGYYSDALQYAQQAFALANQQYGNYNEYTLDTMHTLLTIYPFLKKKREMTNLAEEALMISRELFGDEHKETIDFMALFTQSLVNNGEFDKAKEISYEGCKLAKNLPDYNSKTATEAFLEAREINMRFIAGLAEIHSRLGDFKSAIKMEKSFIEEAKKIHGEKSLTTILHMSFLSKYYIAVHDFNSAIKLNTEALKLLKENSTELQSSTKIHESTKDILGTLALAYYFNNQNKEAVDCYREYISSCEEIRNRYDLFSPEDKSQWFSSVLGSYKLAINSFLLENFFDEAFQTAELCKARNMTERYSENLFNKNNTFDNEDLSKLQAYRSKIYEYSTLIKNYTSRDDISTLISLENEQNQILSDYQDFKAQLQEKYPKYKMFQEMKGSCTLPDFSCLPEDTSYISFIGDDSLGWLFAFVAKSDGTITCKSIIDDSRDSKLKYKYFVQNCRLYHDLLAYSNIESMRAENQYLWKLADGYILTVGRQMPTADSIVVRDNEEFFALRENLSIYLGKILLEPLGDDLDSNWIISPDEELNSVPFETLRYKDKKVIESVNVSYIPSFAVLKLFQERNRENDNLQDHKDFFAMGDAIYGDIGNIESRGNKIDFLRSIDRESKKDINLTEIKWGNLPGTAKELDKISNIFTSKDVYRGKEASESKLKLLNHTGQLSKYKYFLFSTHGIFIPQAPEYSSIVLSQGIDVKEDGYITVGEWMGYNFNSDLVYLSACESGLGDYKAGEGIIGIPYALTIAGNKDTVMSLWKVDDEATAEFTASVFEKLSKGKSEVAALNETKREFLQSNNSKYRDPSVWAAFVLYGI